MSEMDEPWPEPANLVTGLSHPIYIREKIASFLHRSDANDEIPTPRRSLEPTLVQNLVIRPNLVSNEPVSVSQIGG